jgi:heat-inducible transcriptional repressor
MSFQELSERERRVLEAVIQTYVATAEPAGSRTLSRRFGLGVSPATIRNTMSDLEEKGFLFHPHTSAGRVPTNKAYRLYVDSLIRIEPPPSAERERLAEEIASAGSTIEAILRRTAQSLGVLTQELGVAVGPTFEQAVLRRLDLVRLASERLLMVLSLDRGDIRTIFVEVPAAIADDAVTEVARVLNERLGGLTLREIRTSLPARLRDATTAAEVNDLLNIFVSGGTELFGAAAQPGTDVLLSQPSLLADQPEFASGERLRRLLELTETRDDLASLLRQRATTGSGGISITIGSEHGDPRLEPFTVVTAEYHAGGLTGVIGVLGPTRMPYEKVISIVSHASRLVSELLH